MKFLKALLAIVLLLIVLAVVAVFALTKLVSTDRLKPFIAAIVKENTGLNLDLQGNIAWKLFPMAGIQVEKMILTSNASDKELLKIEVGSATFDIKLMPLMHGIIESQGLSVENTNLLWRALPSDPTYSIKNISFQAKNIHSLQPFPIKGKFDFSVPNKSKGHLNFSTIVSMNTAEKIYSLRTVKLDGTVSQSEKKYKITLTTEAIANLKVGTVVCDTLNGKINNATFTGKMSVKNLQTTPITQGQLKFLPFNLKTFLQTSNQDSEAVQIANDLEASIDFKHSKDGVIADGNFSLADLRISGMLMENPAGNFNYKNKTLTLSKFDSKFYEGKISAQSAINLTSNAPQIKLQAKLENIQGEPFFKDMQKDNSSLTISGVGNLQLNLTTEGNDNKSLTKNMNGTAQFSFDQGAISGVDIGFMIENAYAVIKNETLSTESDNKTYFGNLNGTAVIENGIFINRDLFIDSPKLTTNGKGKINFIDQSIDFSLQSVIKKQAATDKNKLENLYGLTIPITITGHLQSPKIRIDSSELLKSVAKDQINKEAKKLQEKFKDKISPEANQLLNNLLGG